jgi:hypothetical protein
VVDSIRRASAHAFRHQAGKNTEYSFYAVHVIDVQRAARPVFFSNNNSIILVHKIFSLCSLTPWLRAAPWKQERAPEAKEMP